MNPAAVLALSGPAILLVWAQAPAPGPQTTLPGVAAELVEVDVMVTDRAGRPVPGLIREDFLLLEDGQPQPLAVFLGVADPNAEAIVMPPAEHAREAPPGTRGRHIVFAVDDLHLSAGSLAQAKAALKRTLAEELADDDEVAVVTCSGTIGLVQPFTRERAVLARAIDRLRYREARPSTGGRATMTEYQALAIERGDAQAIELAVREIEQQESLPIPGMRNPRLDSEVRSMARNVLSQSLAATGAARDTLAELLRSLEGVRGRKAVVLVSDGFLLGAGTDQGSDVDLRPLMDSATRSRVSIFALDSRGMFALAPGGDASRPGSVVQAMPGLQQRYEREGSQALRDGMRDLAESTGGFLVQGTNDLSGAMARILDSHAAAYVLAYSPTTKDDKRRFHKIEVKLVRRPELVVHARRGYFSAAEGGAKAGTDADTASPAGRDAEIRRALASVTPLQGVPLRLAASFVGQPPESGRIEIRAHVDLSRVTFDEASGRHDADLDLASTVFDEDGGSAAAVEGQRATMHITPDNLERVLREGLGYRRSVQVQPGLYQVRMVVREDRSHTLGSASQWIEVPDLGRGTLVLSDVVLFAEGAATGNEFSQGLRDVHALRRYPRGARLYYTASAYNPRRGEGGSTDVVAQAQVWGGGRAQGASPPQPLAFDGATAAAGGRIALEGLGPGEYELRVLVVDRKVPVTVQKSIGFTIE